MNHEVCPLDASDETTSNFEYSFDQSQQYESSDNFEAFSVNTIKSPINQANQTVLNCNCAARRLEFIPLSPCPSGDLQHTNLRTKRVENLSLLQLIDKTVFLVKKPGVYKRYGNLVLLLNIARFQQLLLLLQRLRREIFELQNIGDYNRNVIQQAKTLIKIYATNSNIFVFESSSQTYELKMQNFADFNYSRNYVLTQMSRVTYIKSLLLPHKWSNFPYRDQIVKKFQPVFGSVEFESIADTIAKGGNAIFTVDKNGLKIYYENNSIVRPGIKVDQKTLKIDLQCQKKKRPDCILYISFKNIETVIFEQNQLSVAYVICEAARTIQCQNCDLQQLIISDCWKLEKLYAFGNQIQTINVKMNRKLTTLCLHQNNITELDLSQNKELEWLGLYKNQISQVVLSNNLKLQELFVQDNNLEHIDVTPCKALRIMNIENNQLTELSIENCKNLTYVLAKDNFLYALNATGCSKLQEIRISTICQSFDITISKEDRTRIYFDD